MTAFDLNIKEKACSCCGQVKPLSDFYKQGDRKSGLRSQCKNCCSHNAIRDLEKGRENIKIWRDKNPEKVKAQQKRHREKPEHREKRDKYMAKYREEHRDELNKKNKWSQIKTLYGLNKEEWELLWTQQDGKCAICGKKFESYAKADTDHDHQSGNPRGLLCRRCNAAIGIFNDDVDLMNLAIEYILKYKNTHA